MMHEYDEIYDDSKGVVCNVFFVSSLGSVHKILRVLHAYPKHVYSILTVMIVLMNNNKIMHFDIEA